ncbi:MAG: T9SS type A sorting domain-containing protein [Flavobacteriales bacterium]
MRPTHAVILAGIVPVLFTVSASAQNLVPNPSFEDVLLCPDDFSQLDRTALWFSPTLGGSPDYFHACSASFGVPANSAGEQPAYEGEAYVGIYLWIQDITDAREYVEVQLTAPLEPGICYHFSMWVSLSDNSLWTTDAIGVYLSTTALADVPGYPPLGVQPIVENPIDILLKDQEWIEVAGDFTAAGGEAYLIIGNFFDDANTTTVQTDGFIGDNAYCYVDGVSLEPCIIDAVPGIRPLGDRVGPNPFSDRLSIGSGVEPNSQLRILNARGALVYEGGVGSNAVLNTAAWPAGFYSLELLAPDGSRAHGKFVKD